MLPCNHYLTLEDVKRICFAIATRIYQFNEPIPAFETRFKSKLEAILNIPNQNVFCQELYPTIYDKAACYFYFTIKDHPFLNGNKRLAIVSTFVFLGLNGIMFKAPWQLVYSLAMELSKSSNNDKDYYFNKIKKIIKKYSKKINFDK